MNPVINARISTVKLHLNFEEYIPIFVDVLLHHKTKQEFIFCIDNAKVYQKAVL